MASFFYRAWVLWLFVVLSSSLLARAMDLLLYDGSHRTDVDKDSSVTAELTAPALGSVWAAGADGEMLRDSGAGWEPFASFRGNGAIDTLDANGNLVLFPSPTFQGDWAAGENEEFIRDVSSHFEVGSLHVVPSQALRIRVLWCLLHFVSSCVLLSHSTIR